MKKIYKSNRSNEILRFVLGAGICIAVPTTLGIVAATFIAPLSLIAAGITVTAGFIIGIKPFLSRKKEDKKNDYCGIGNRFVRLVALKPQEGAVISFMGKNNRAVEGGVVCLYKFPLQMTEKFSTLRSLKSSIVDLPAQNYITSDNINLNMDFDYMFSVNDLTKYAVVADSPEKQLGTLIKNAILQVVSEQSFDDLKLNRSIISEKVTKIVASKANALGFELHEITCKSIQPDKETQDMLERQKAAEMAVKIAEEKRKAAKIEAASEADVIKEIETAYQNIPLEHQDAVVATIYANKGITYYPKGAAQPTTAEAMINTKLDSIIKTNREAQKNKKVKVLVRKK